MNYKVTKKQYNSSMCLVCGLENGFGVRASFYELENGELAALFHSPEEHQSYPGRVHGGISGAVLDEVICRTIMITEPDTWGITVELSLKYLKPVPLNEPLKAVGRVTKNSRKIFEGTAELLLAGGDVAVTATGKYLKMPFAQITDSDEHRQEWRIVTTAADPQHIEL